MDKIINKIKNDLENQIKTSPTDQEILRKFKQTLDHVANLDQKTRDLINVALTISSQPTGCFEKIIKEAMRDGISRDEILGAACLALIQLNGAATTVLKPLLDALNKNIYEKLRSDNYWLDLS